METKEYVYHGKIVEFLFGDDIMINATEMAAVFGKRVAKFLELESTKKWINHLEKTAIRANRSPDSGLRFAGNGIFDGEIVARSPDLIPILVVKKGGDDGGATWMHRLLAIEFAMWLDLDFKLWVILKIDQMLFDYGMGKRTLKIEAKKLEEEELGIFQNSEAPEVKRLLEIRNAKKQLKGEELNLNKKFNNDLFG